MTDAASTEVLVVDPSPLTRICMVAGLQADSRLRMFGVGSLDELCPCLPSAILLRWHNRSGVEQLRNLLERAVERWPEAGRIVVADAVDEPCMVTCARAGANGCLTYDVDLDLLTDVVLLARHRLIVYSAGQTPPMQVVPKAVDARHALPPIGTAQLTIRQRQVSSLLALGHTNRAIADRLGISESTVKAHVRSVMEIIGVTNRTQVAARVLQSDYRLNSDHG